VHASVIIDVQKVIQLRKNRKQATLLSVFSQTKNRPKTRRSTRI